jgi:ABC-type Mn2+/Zn2+ transport system permease subunit
VDEDLGILANVTLTVVVAGCSVAIIGVALVWHAVSLASKAVQAITRTP